MKNKGKVKKVVEHRYHLVCELRLGEFSSRSGDLSVLIKHQRKNCTYSKPWYIKFTAFTSLVNNKIALRVISVSYNICGQTFMLSGIENIFPGLG